MSDPSDLLTLGEAKTALHVGNDASDTNIARVVTAVSHLLDDLCGPVVQRTVTAERIPGGCPTIELDQWPWSSITAFTNYVGITGSQWAEVALSATGQGWRPTPVEQGTGRYGRTLTSVQGNFGDWVEVTYTAGRYESTTNVAAHFKEAAVICVKNLYRSYEVSVGEVGGFDVAYPTFPAAYAVPNSARDTLGDDWRGQRNPAHVGVLFG